MDMDSSEKFRRMMLRILNHPKLILFGCIIYNFDIELIEVDKTEVEPTVLNRLTAFATIKDEKPYIGFFSCFVEQCSVEELTFVGLHEVLHILDGHGLRRGDRDPFISNLAADHVINVPLMRDSSSLACTKIPNGDKTPFVINKLKDTNCTYEEVYDYLMKNATKKPVTFTLKGSANGKPMKIKVQTTTLKVNGKEITVISDIVTSKDPNARDVVEQVRASTRAAVNEAKNRGLDSGGIMELVSKLIKVKVPWDKLYEKAIRSKAVISPDRRVWTNPRKRLRTHGFILPGPTYDHKASTLMVVRDTSGSVNEEDLSRFIYVTIQGGKLFERVRILDHDVKVEKDVMVDSVLLNESNFKSNRDVAGFKGRGGTSHRHVFELIEKSKNEGDEISLIIFLTDNYSDFPCISEFSWPEDYPFIMLLTKEHSVPDRGIDYIVMD